MKRQAIFILLLVAIGIGFCIDQFIGKENNTEIHTQCKETLAKNHDALLSLMGSHQGEFVDRDSEAFRAFSAPFAGDLEWVDLRDPKGIVFSFSSFHPETAKRLIYCPDNRIQMRADTFLEEAEEELRLEKLGAGDGYIWCIRIKECWFYWESYLPT